MEFYIKYFLRLVHICSACFVIGNAISDYLWEKREGKYYIALQIIAGVFLIISGMVNMILLKPSSTMKELKTPWNILVKFKFCLWLLLLPIPEFFCKQLGIPFSRVTFNIPLLGVILAISSFMKQYRDWAISRNSKIR